MSRGAFTDRAIRPDRAQIEAIPKLRSAIDSANPYAEGRWIFLEVASQRELGAVERLIEIRAASR